MPPYLEREFRRYLDWGILAHLGAPTALPRIAPARGPPLWEAVSAEHESTPDPALLPTPAFVFDQRLTW